MGNSHCKSDQNNECWNAKTKQKRRTAPVFDCNYTFERIAVIWTYAWTPRMERDSTKLPTRKELSLWHTHHDFSSLNIDIWRAYKKHIIYNKKWNIHSEDKMFYQLVFRLILTTIQKKGVDTSSQSEFRSFASWREPPFAANRFMGFLTPTCHSTTLLWEFNIELQVCLATDLCSSTDSSLEARRQTLYKRKGSAKTASQTTTWDIAA